MRIIRNLWEWPMLVAMALGPTLFYVIAALGVVLGIGFALGAWLI